ncbi:MAG TPA: type II toxin-antitoxin system VapC family toxin [bacterium]|nr:type II toxin-antitoxin system VapC family toxin [bacterium]HQL61084.1 type II toxin-antitoxin system VapC family toxin [bacterium]
MVSPERLKGRRVYLDTNVFIYHLIGYQPLRPQLDTVFGLIDREEYRAVTSELTLAEILVKPFRDGNSDQQTQCRALLESNSQIELHPITRSILISAARIRAESTLTLADAIHLATAQTAGRTILLTNDSRLGMAGGIEVVLLPDIEPV